MNPTYWKKSVKNDIITQPNQYQVKMMRKILFFCFIFYPVIVSATYYDILGVSPNASQEDIKRAYQRMILAFHPDRNQAPDATKRTQEINEAYDTLEDPNRRAEYDKKIGSKKYQRRKSTTAEPNNKKRKGTTGETRSKNHKKRGPTDDDSLLHTAIERLYHTLVFSNDPNTHFKKQREQELNIFQTVGVILEGGIDVNAVNSRKETPFALAIKKQLLKVASLLLENKAKPEIQDEDGNNALHLLAMERTTYYFNFLDRLEMEIKSYRFDSGERPLTGLTKKQFSHLHEASTEHIKDILALAKTVIENAKGTSLLTARNSKGDRPLHTAMYEFPELTELIIEALEQEENVDWNAQNNSGETYLAQAIRADLSATFHQLLEKKAKPEIQDKNGNNALHLLVAMNASKYHDFMKHYISVSLDINEIVSATNSTLYNILWTFGIMTDGMRRYRENFLEKSNKWQSETGILGAIRDIIKAAEGINLLIVRNNEGELPIQIAMNTKYPVLVELAELIIEQGGAEALTAEELNSLIQKAIQENWLRILQLLREENIRRESNTESPSFRLDDSCYPSFTFKRNN